MSFWQNGIKLWACNYVSSNLRTLSNLKRIHPNKVCLTFVGSPFLFQPSVINLLKIWSTIHLCSSFRDRVHVTLVVCVCTVYIFWLNFYDPARKVCTVHEQTIFMTSRDVNTIVKIWTEKYSVPLNTDHCDT